MTFRAQPMASISVPWRINSVPFRRPCKAREHLSQLATLSPSERKLQRKALAEQLYKQEFTMEQIGEQFGVTKKTISEDLAGIVTEGNNQKHAKTARNPKGAGRPRGRPLPPGGRLRSRGAARRAVSGLRGLSG